MTEQLKLRRTQDAGELCQLLSHPAIAPTALMGLERPLEERELVGFLEDTRNVALVLVDGIVAKGAILFHYQEPAVYEVHTMAQPDVRGRQYVQFVRDALGIMFRCSDAMELYTKVPESNKGALGLVRLIYGRKQFELADGWQRQKCSYYALSFWDWLWSPLGAQCEKRGHWFHEKLEEQFSSQAREHSKHMDNPAHDRMVGAAVEMIFQGIIVKGLMLYNRWARVAGYSQATVLLAQPLVVNIGDALLQVDVQHKDFQLLETRPEQLTLAAAGEGAH